MLSVILDGTNGQLLATSKQQLSQLENTRKLDTPLQERKFVSDYSFEANLSP
jgi:hypothetical protein